VAARRRPGESPFQSGSSAPTRPRPPVRACPPAPPRTPRGAHARHRWRPSGIRSLNGRTARAVAVAYGAAMGRGQSSAPPQQQYDDHNDNDDDYGAKPDINWIFLSLQCTFWELHELITS